MDNLSARIEEIRQMGKAQKFYEVLQLCSILEREAPYNSEVQFLKGAAYFKIGDHKNAREMWQRVLAIEPGNTDVRNWLAKLPPEAPPPSPPPIHDFGFQGPSSSMSSHSEWGSAPPPPSNTWGQPQPAPSREAPPIKAAGYATFLSRFAACFVDGILCGIGAYMLSFVVGMVFGGAFATSDVDPEFFLLFVGLFGQVIGFIFWWLYFAMQESSVYQATLGKRMVGIVVTDLSGNKLTFGRATGRYFGKILSNITCLIGYLMALFTERKQALHDMVAGTLVMVRG